MEVLAIAAWFILMVVTAGICGAYLFARALERDRTYLLATGELSLPEDNMFEIEEDTSLVLDAAEPVGTLALLLVYLMVLIGLWFAMLTILLQRS